MWSYLKLSMSATLVLSTNHKGLDFIILRILGASEPNLISLFPRDPLIRVTSNCFKKSARQPKLFYHNSWKNDLICFLIVEWADIVLRGYGGWNSRRALQVLDQIFPKNAIEQPSLVIVYFGGNDSMRPHPSGLGPHVPLQEYIENMRKIAIHVQSLSKKTRTIFLSTPPINEAQIRENSDPLGQPSRTNESCRIYSEACLEVCREMNIKAIDLWSAIQKRDDWLDVCFIDGIHLSVEGSKIVVKEILKVLKEADWEPSLHWKSMPIEFDEDSPYDPVGPDGKTTINISSLPFPESIEWEWD